MHKVQPPKVASKKDPKMPFIQDLTPLCHPSCYHFVATATAPRCLDIDFDLDGGYRTSAPHLKYSSSSSVPIAATVVGSGTHSTTSTALHFPPPSPPPSFHSLSPPPSFHSLSPPPSFHSLSPAVSASSPALTWSPSPNPSSPPSSTMGGTYYYPPDDNSGEAPPNPASYQYGDPNDPNNNPNNGPLAISNSASSTSVAQALEIARDSAEGAADPVVLNILESAIAHIWRRVLAQPDVYVMSRDEFAVFNYFQARFVDNVVAMEARKRYWDHTSGGT